MGFVNTCVVALLRSPVHGVLSGSTDVIRYRGRRTGAEHTTPTQYARHGDDVVILVGTPETKTWWRNFRTEADLDLLLRGTWTPMTAVAIVGAEAPDRVAPLLDAYLARFPRAVRSLPGATPAERAVGAVVVRCRPRS